MNHLEQLLKRRPELTACESEIQTAVEKMTASFRNGGKLLLCGNGGSAADAEHWSGELLKGFEKSRRLSTEARARLPQVLADNLQEGLPVIPLTSFVSLQTAFANDVDPQLSFAQLVWSLGIAKDVLVGISTSGNAANVCHAVEAAKAKGLTTIGLTGADGGKLRKLVDLCICAPGTRTCLIQEHHLPIYHTICLMLEEEFFGEEAI